MEAPRGQQGRLPRQSAPAGRSRATLPAGLALAWAAAHGTQKVSGSLLTVEDGSCPFSLSLPDTEGVRAELLPAQQARGRGTAGAEQGLSRGCKQRPLEHFLCARRVSSQLTQPSHPQGT